MPIACHVALGRRSHRRTCSHVFLPRARAPAPVARGSAEGPGTLGGSRRGRLRSLLAPIFSLGGNAGEDTAEVLSELVSKGSDTAVKSSNICEASFGLDVRPPLTTVVSEVRWHKLPQVWWLIWSPI